MRLLIDGDADAGLDEFLRIIEARLERRPGEKRLIAAFSTLDDEELVGTYRRRMASLLF